MPHFLARAAGLSESRAPPGPRERRTDCGSPHARLARPPLLYGTTRLRAGVTECADVLHDARLLVIRLLDQEAVVLNRALRLDRSRRRLPAPRRLGHCRRPAHHAAEESDDQTEPKRTRRLDPVAGDLRHAAGDWASSAAM